MWGDLYGRHVIHDAFFSSTSAVTKMLDCQADALDICNTIYENAKDVQACKHGVTHGEVHDFSKFSQAYILGNLVEKFKCGGLRQSDQCVSYRAAANICNSALCTSRSLSDNNGRYSKIDLSHVELASADVAEILNGELLSRVKC